MPFKLTCHINLHDGLHKNVKSSDDRRSVSWEVAKFVIERELVPKNRTGKFGICEGCLSRVKTLMGQVTTVVNKPGPSRGLAECMELSISSESDKLNDATNIVCDAVAQKSLSPDQLKRLLHAVAKFIGEDLKASPPLNETDRLDAVLTTAYSVVWRNTSPCAAVDFLTSLGGVSIEDEETKSRKLVKTLEQFRWLCFPSYISNLALGEALFLQQYAHSQKAIEIFGRSVPSGSYSTLKRTIGQMDKQATILPANDVVIAFDNNQKIMKTYMVKYFGKQVVSIVTSMVAFNGGQLSKHQFQVQIPTALLPTAQNRQELISRYEKFHDSSVKIHRECRQSFIENTLRKVSLECSIRDGKVQDTIYDDKLGDNHYEEFFTYTRVLKVDRNVPVMDLDCINVNPNSYKTVQQVLDNILTQIEKTDRKYIVVVMDGAPYCLAIKLLRTIHVCSICKETVADETLTTHQSSHGDVVPAFTRKYKKIIIRPGAGHIEMNMVRNILSFFWIPFIEPFAKILGFKTEAALLYAKRGSDHHKSYNMLMIIHAAISYELIFAYISASAAANKTPSYADFCIWDRKHAENNKTYKFAADFAFTTLHALQLYRCGIRMCNDIISAAARERMASLFYITNCPKYQELIAYDTLYLLTLPEADRVHVGMDSARQNKGQFGEGFDFLMESRNKLYKSFLTNEPSPTYDRWLSVTRSTGSLLQVREAASQRLVISHHDNDIRERKFANEIFQVRKKIRSLQLLNQEVLELFSFDDDPVKLDHDILDYISDSVENMKQFISLYLHDKKGHLTSLTVSKQDVNFDNFKSAKESVGSKISSLKGPSFSFFNNHLKSCKNKDDLISLHKAVMYTQMMQQDIDVDEVETSESSDEELLT